VRALVQHEPHRNQTKFETTLANMCMVDPSTNRPPCAMISILCVRSCAWQPFWWSGSLSFWKVRPQLLQLNSDLCFHESKDASLSLSSTAPFSSMSCGADVDRDWGVCWSVFKYGARGRHSRW